MILGVILEASLQEIFVVAVRNEDTIRGFYVGFFFLFNNMSILIKCRWNIIECTNQYSQ